MKFELEIALQFYKAHCKVSAVFFKLICHQVQSLLPLLLWAFVSRLLNLKYNRPFRFNLYSTSKDHQFTSLEHSCLP